ncbi:MAG: phospholipase/carboxylesterase [Gaiellales bacterium]|nr:phospholipase/carboxylesterase [Gaiellales bacterium]
MASRDDVTAVEEFVHRYEPGAGPVTLLLLHGTGGDEHQLIDLGRQLAPEAALLSPRGAVLEDGVAARFFARRGIGDLDLDDLRRRGDDLAAWVGEACLEYERDRARVIALGYSNGANIGVELLFRHPGVLRAAALLRPMLPYRPDWPLELTGTDVLIATGDADPYSPRAQVAELAGLLAGGGAVVQVERQPTGHGLVQADLDALATWMRPRVSDRQ